MKPNCRNAFLALACGIFVGTQLNESIRVLDVYVSKTSKIDSMPADGPQDVRRQVPVRETPDFYSENAELVPAHHPSGLSASLARNDQKMDSSPSHIVKSSSDQKGLVSKKPIHRRPRSGLDSKDQLFPVAAEEESRAIEINDNLTLKASIFRGTKLSLRSGLEQAPSPQEVSDQIKEGEPTNVAISMRNKPSSNRTMNACLFIMDDTIRLTEWLAYHFTVLPLGHVIVAIDPKSKRTDKINGVLDMWRDYLEIDAYYNDSFLTLDPYEGWGRSIYGSGKRPRGWFKNKKGYSYRSQAHKRRQNFFSSFCFGELWEKGKRDWTILTDTDEFVIYNYRYPETEDSSRYDSETLFKSKEEIEKERKANVPMRDNLPKLFERITIADYLEQHKERRGTAGEKLGACLRIPGLTFSSQESNSSEIQRDSPEGIDGSNLMTLRHRKHAEKDGTFSKAILNLRIASSKQWFDFGSVQNVHTPNRRMCGRTTKQEHSGSGADYISSLLRLHHYKGGTIESYLERAGDWRGGGLWRFYSDRNTKPVGENSDLAPWLRWFVDKVGHRAAEKLLIHPLMEFYDEIGSLREIREAKEAIGKLAPMLADGKKTFRLEDPTYYKRTNKTIGTCMYIMNDSLRLMEWLAYHYTTLPLSHLILGIDPASTREQEINKVIQIWKPFVRIEVYTNSSWMSGLGEEEGWKRRIRPRGSNETMPWFLDKNSSEFLSQAHKRRQNTFIGKCLGEMQAAGQTWVAITDSDEFITFNHLHDDENESLYDTVESSVRTKEDIDKAREQTISMRKRLPKLQEHVTVADFIDAEGADEKCFRMPALNFSAYQDPMTRAELPPTADLLCTLTQHRTGPKEGRFSKALVDVSKEEAQYLDWARVDSAHNPSRRLCGYNGRLSGTDYAASVLRIHHYVAGTIEQYIERGNDFRGSQIERYLTSRHFEPMGENHDIDYWIDWFIFKVGMTNAEKLLFKPIMKTNNELAHVHSVKALKTKMKDLKILPTLDDTLVALNDEEDEG